MWGSKKGQGAHWLGRRASEKTSWRRLESRVGWSHREECERGFRQRARLGQRHGRENGQGRGRRGAALSSSLLSGLLFVGYPWLCMGASEVAQWHPLQTGYSKSPGGAMASGHTAQPDSKICFTCCSFLCSHMTSHSHQARASPAPGIEMGVLGWAMGENRTWGSHWA